MLEALGLSGTAETLYRALLTNGPTIETRLTELVGDTDDTVLAAAIDELHRADLVQRISGEPACWLAGSPEVALTSLVVQQQEALLERQRDLERAQSTVSELIRLSRSRAPGSAADVVEITTDAEATRRRCRHFERTTERCVMALEKLTSEAEGGDPEPATLAMLDRGIEVQSVYERPVLLVPGRFETLRRLAAAGEQARTLPNVPLQVVVFDRAHAMVRLDDDEVASSALFVHHSGLLTGLLCLFDLLWERAVPIPPEPDVPVEERSPDTDDVLLSLLAAGFKDESIARHLHISPSTVTRRMARLMELTGTSTRFQLGMQAVRRGWI